MTLFTKIFIIYIAIMSLTGFLSMFIDKRKAIKGKWRIPEKTLFLISILGGSIGSLIGMKLFRHKTKHWYFVVFMPAILILHIALVIFLQIEFDLFF